MSKISTILSLDGAHEASVAADKVSPANGRIALSSRDRL